MIDVFRLYIAHKLLTPQKSKNFHLTKINKGSALFLFKNGGP